MAKKYKCESILSDPRFKKYQKDFLKAVLNKPEYTIAEAVKTAKAFFIEKE